jgi:hypothetical protein
LYGIHAVDKKNWWACRNKIVAANMPADAVDKPGRVIKGGSGVWGTRADVPANAQVSADEAKKNWVAFGFSRSGGNCVLAVIFNRTRHQADELNKKARRRLYRARAAPD